MPPFKVKKLHPDAKIPTRNFPTDAGLDLYSVETVTVHPVNWPSRAHFDGSEPLSTRALVKTGIAVAVPVGYGLFIWDRSGLSSRHGLHRLAGVVDSSYRGEVCVVLVNLGDSPYTIKAGDKVAQGILAPIALSQAEEVDELDSTERGEKGFGSSGT